MLTLKSVAFALALALAGTLSGHGRADAHASLVTSMPEDGAVLSRAPSSLGLRFNEPVRVLVTRLIAPDGSLSELDARGRGEHVEIPLPAALREGSYLLSWRVVSGDGHPVAGSFAFSIGTPGGAAARRPDTLTGLSPALWAARVALYVGLLFGIGGAVGLAWITPGLKPRWPRRTGAAASVIGISGAVTGLALSGLDLLGLGWADLLTTAPWRAAGSTSLGISTALVAAGLLLSLASLARGARQRSLSALSLVLGAGGLAATGHAAAASPELLARTSVVLHGAAAMVWMGALVPLGAAAVRGLPALMEPLRRFSIVSLVVVAVLALTGTIIAVLQVQDPAALLATDYGQVLCAKLALVAALLALAAVNRLVLTPRIRVHDLGAPRWLAVVIAAEIGLGMAVAGTVALWRFTPPPRALAATAQPPDGLAFHLHGAAAMVDVTMRPGRVGETTADIIVLGADFDTLDARDVTITLARPDQGIGPLERRAERLPDGRWRANGLVVPLPGRWSVTVQVLIDDFDKATLEGEIRIPAGAAP